jgi:hypothetical protein
MQYCIRRYLFQKVKNVTKGPPLGTEKNFRKKVATGTPIKFFYMFFPFFKKTKLFLIGLPVATFLKNLRKVTKGGPLGVSFFFARSGSG